MVIERESLGCLQLEFKKKSQTKLTHAWEASKGVIGEGHGPLVVEERGWRWSRDIEDRPGRDVVLGMG